MTMFEELFALACSATLTMTVSADEKSGRLTVNVIPKPRQDAGEPGLTQPLSLTATPQEFDAGFIEALRGYREVRQSLAQQAEATKEVIEAAKAASVKKASDATVKAGASKSVPAKPVTAPAVSASDSAADDEEEGDASQAPAAGAVPATATGSDSFDLFG
ncbi:MULTISPECIES: PRTRC system protein E [Comamonadaceae]|uniref:PRTRC system protein E n=1 Tax=Alicycliphilus denitrificans (strain DSM 14773 / CIP 107495 / K601) TaxID=596154 RepID=F4G944_ALIDK|nr:MULTISPECIES: PRTRC system protein E [Comamonadaceae]AEB85634.1 PRTRC system protein E [Alicycliphilus denitrificans K601]